MGHTHEHDTLCPSLSKDVLPATYCTFCTLIKKVEERTRYTIETFRP